MYKMQKFAPPFGIYLQKFDVDENLVMENDVFTIILNRSNLHSS